MRCIKCGKEVSGDKCICGFNHGGYFFSVFTAQYNIEKRMDQEADGCLAEIISEVKAKVERGTSSDMDFVTSIFSFVMPIEDAFSITERGIVVVGKVLAGSVRVGEPVQVVFENGKVVPVTISDIEMYRKKLSAALVGDSVGLFLDGVNSREEIAGAWAVVM